MNTTLLISLDHSQGALLRVLGAIERRGWTVRSLSLDGEGSNGALLRCDLSRRPFHAGGPDILGRHLEKLECVGRVETAAAAPRWAVAAPAAASAATLQAMAVGAVP
ncbi:MAG: hypothetical protein Tsb008_15470 [Rhodothalassiaceae bacterium]